MYTLKIERSEWAAFLEVGDYAATVEACGDSGTFYLNYAGRTNHNYNGLDVLPKGAVQVCHATLDAAVEAAKMALQLIIRRDTEDLTDQADAIDRRVDVRHDGPICPDCGLLAGDCGCHDTVSCPRCEDEAGAADCSLCGGTGELPTRQGAFVPVLPTESLIA